MKNLAMQQIVLGLALLGVAGTASAESDSIIVPILQNRSLTVAASWGSTTPVATNLVTAPDFGGFNFTNSVSGVIDHVYPYLIQAGQNSQLGATAITATGFVTDEPGALSVGYANSEIIVTFRLAAPVTYSLAGSLSWNEAAPDPAGPPSPLVRLSNAAGVIYETPAVGSDGVAVSYTTSGTLDAGAYTLEANALAAIPFGFITASKSFEVNFSVVSVDHKENLDEDCNSDQSLDEEQSQEAEDILAANE